MFLLNDFQIFAKERLSGFIGRDWLIDRIKAWQNDRSSQRYFLIVGEAGIGKSAFAAHLWMNCNLVDAVHFCIGGRRGTIEPRSFVKSISEQLALNDPKFAKALRSTVEQQNITIQSQISTGNITGGSKVIGVEIAIELNAAPETVFDQLIRQPFQIMADDNDLMPTIILVDALDEALTFSGKVSIIDLLVAANDLPDGVRFIITTRNDPRILNSFDELSSYIIYAQSPENQQDISNFLDHEWNVDTNLRQAAHEWGWEKKHFINYLGERAEWNFLYLRNIVPLIASGSITSPDELPIGLDNYYAYILRSRFDQHDWESWTAELLEILLAFYEPVLLDQLADILGWDIRPTFQRLLKVSQLLDPALFQDERYWPYHWSIVEYLNDRNKAGIYWCDIDSGYQKIVDYYLKQENWDKHDGYAFRNLSKHLLQVNRIEDLDILLRSHNWMGAQQQFDSSLYFYRREIAEMIESLATQVSKTDVANLIGWILLESLIRERANQISIEVLKLLVLFGKKDVLKRYLNLIVGPARRSEIFYQLGLFLYDHGYKEWGRNLVKESLEATRLIVTDKGVQAGMLANLAAALIHVGLPDLGIIVAEENPDSGYLSKSNALGAVAKYYISINKFEMALYTANRMIPHMFSAQPFAEVTLSFAKKGQFDSALLVSSYINETPTHKKSETLFEIIKLYLDKESSMHAFYIAERIEDANYFNQAMELIIVDLSTKFDDTNELTKFIGSRCYSRRWKCIILLSLLAKFFIINNNSLLAEKYLILSKDELLAEKKRPLLMNDDSTPLDKDDYGFEETFANNLIDIALIIFQQSNEYNSEKIFDLFFAIISELELSNSIRVIEVISEKGASFWGKVSSVRLLKYIEEKMFTSSKKENEKCAILLRQSIIYYQLDEIEISHKIITETTALVFRSQISLSKETLGVLCAGLVMHNEFTKALDLIVNGMDKWQVQDVLQVAIAILLQKEHFSSVQKLVSELNHEYREEASFTLISQLVHLERYDEALTSLSKLTKLELIAKSRIVIADKLKISDRKMAYGVLVGFNLDDLNVSGMPCKKLIDLLVAVTYLLIEMGYDEDAKENLHRIIDIHCQIDVDSIWGRTNALDRLANPISTKDPGYISLSDEVRIEKMANSIQRSVADQKWDELMHLIELELKHIQSIPDNMGNTRIHSLQTLLNISLLAYPEIPTAYTKEVVVFSFLQARERGASEIYQYIGVFASVFRSISIDSELLSQIKEMEKLAGMLS